MPSSARTALVRKAPTSGHFWRFAGLDPTLRWAGPKAAAKQLELLGIDGQLSASDVDRLSEWSGQHSSRIWNVWNNGFRDRRGKKVPGKAGLVQLFSVRPWNERLKTICLGRLGDSFNKQRGRDSGFYGKLVDVGTMGGAGQLLGGRWMGYLLGAQRILVAYDNDEAGDKGAGRWAAAFPGRVRRVRVPSGTDVTDFWQAGGDVRSWVTYQVGRLGV